MGARLYTDAQWTKAARLWIKGNAPADIASTTGVPVHSLYNRCRTHPEQMKSRGPRTIRPDRLKAIKSDYQRGTPLRAMAETYRLDRTRFGQLAQQHGWTRTHHTAGKRYRTLPVSTKPKPGPLLPKSRRCCGVVFRARQPCPRCGDQLAR